VAVLPSQVAPASKQPFSGSSTSSTLNPTTYSWSFCHTVSVGKKTPSGTVPSFKPTSRYGVIFTSSIFLLAIACATVLCSPTKAVFVPKTAIPAKAIANKPKMKAAASTSINDCPD
jgi:hypothetical protein